MGEWQRVWISERKNRREPSYRLQWTDEEGRRRTRSVGPNLKHAERERVKLEAEINRGDFREVKKILLKRFAEEHLRLMEGRVQPATLASQRTALSLLAEVADESRRLDKIGYAVIERFVKRRRNMYRLRWYAGGGRVETCEADSDPERAEAMRAEREVALNEGRSGRRRKVQLDAPASPATVNKDLRTLKAILNHAVKRGYMRDNPVMEVRFLREPEKVFRVLSRDEINRLLLACPGLTWRAICFMALTTGVRKGEWQNLQWEDVDLEAGIATIRNHADHRTKTARVRRVALVPALVAMLRQLKGAETTGYVFRNESGGRLRYNIHKKLARIVKDAGIPHCTMHDFRETCASHMAMAGVSEAIVGKCLGHSNTQTTRKHYEGILPEALAAAPRLLSYADLPDVTHTVTRDRKGGRRENRAS